MYSQMGTYWAHVTGNGTGLIPSGTVTFYLADGTVLGSATLNASGVATIATPYVPAGSPTVYADYTGAAGFARSTGTVVESIAKATPVVQLGTATPSAVLGQAVTFTGSALPSEPGGLVPTGTATFVDTTTGATLASDVPLVNGRAVLTISTLAIGDHTIRFTYDSGDANYVAGGSATATTTVSPAAASTSLQLIGPTTAYTQSVVTLTALVSANGQIPVGSIEFFDGGSPIGTAQVSSAGVATLSLPDLPMGNHSFTAAFTASGGGFSPSMSAAVNTNVVFNPLAPVTLNTAINITPIYLPPPSSVPKALGGRNTRLKFEVQVLSGIAGVPNPASGTVTVFANGTPIGTYQLNAQGEVTVMLMGQTAFNKTIVVRYNGVIQGVTTYSPSSSDPFVANRAFFYGNSPEVKRSSHAKVHAHHPAGPAAAFRALPHHPQHPAATVGTSLAHARHALVRSIGRRPN
jgi:hypothetical protein